MSVKLQLSRVIAVCLLTVGLVFIQQRLWLGEGGVFAYWGLSQQAQAMQEENERLAQRNEALTVEINDLKSGLALLEERARSELGMIKPGETFFHIIHSDSSTSNR